MDTHNLNSRIAAIMRGIRKTGFRGDMKNQIPIALRANGTRSVIRFRMEVYLHGMEFDDNGEGIGSGGALSYVIYDDKDVENLKEWEIQLLGLMTEENFSRIEFIMNGEDRIDCILHHADSQIEKFSIPLDS